MQFCGTKRKFTKKEVERESKDFLRVGEQRFPYHCCICQQYHLTKQKNMIDTPLELIGELKTILQSALDHKRTYNMYQISSKRTLHHVKIDGIKYGFIHNKESGKLTLQLMMEEN